MLYHSSWSFGILLFEMATMGKHSSVNKTKKMLLQHVADHWYHKIVLLSLLEIFGL